MSVPVKEQVLKDIKPETRHAIVHVLKGSNVCNSDVCTLIITNALENFTEIEGLSVFIKLSITWKAFHRAFLGNEDVLWHLYRAYSKRTGIPNHPDLQHHQNEPHYPDITLKRSWSFPPKDWETPETMTELNRRYFSNTARKILVLAYTPWCSHCHTPRIIGDTESFPIWRVNVRLCVSCLQSNFTSDRELLREYGYSIIGSKYNSKKDVAAELRESSALYFSLGSSVANKILSKISKNPIDFVQGPESRTKN